MPQVSQEFSSRRSRSAAREQKQQQAALEYHRAIEAWEQSATMSRTAIETGRIAEVSEVVLAMDSMCWMVGE